MSLKQVGIEVTCFLGQLYSTWEYLSLSFCFTSNCGFLLICFGGHSSQGSPSVSPCHAWARPGCSFCLLFSGWPDPGHGRHTGCEPAGGICLILFFLSTSYSFSLYLSNKQTWNFQWKIKSIDIFMFSVSLMPSLRYMKQQATENVKECTILSIPGLCDPLGFFVLFCFLFVFCFYLFNLQ